MHTETMPPSIPHEAVVEVLHNEPQLVAMLLGKLGTHLPSGAAPFFLDSNLSLCDPRWKKTCDVVLLVVGLGKKAVRGSEKAIPTGHPGFDLTPLVTGHGRLPGAGGPVFARS
jgi:hypothetical protein